MMGQWVPALLWMVLQKLHEAASWLWQHAPGSRARDLPQRHLTEQEVGSAERSKAAVTATSRSDMDGQHEQRNASQRRELRELDELIRACETLGRERS